MMTQNFKTALDNILFLDIETVPQEASFANLSEEKQALFADKTQYQRSEDISVEDFYQKAGIWAEFGKIICISVGYLVKNIEDFQFRVTSFTGDEAQILTDFKNLLEKYFNKPEHLLCAHNGKEFDFPYIARRMIINRIGIPEKLNLFGKKPWEITHLDTMDLWKFGDYKHYTSLKLLANILDIPSPKDDIDGSQVADVYYKEKDIKRIARYCEKDTITVAQLLLRFNNQEILKEKDIIFV
jgi:3'-5' exonuclease